MDLISTLFYRIFCILMSFLALIPINQPASKTKTDHTNDNTNYAYVFVSGFGGWGENDIGYDKFPYWGGLTGDLIKTLNQNGYTAVAPCINPVGSAWDRACEMYAQLTGTVVDYGEAHSEKYGHERYGTDYTGKAMLTKWDGENKINLIAHSFGGPTSSLFASLMAYGSEEEINTTKDGTVSGLFTGGKGDYIYSITGLAGAYNGTTLTVAEKGLSDALYTISKLPLSEEMKNTFEYFNGDNIAAPDTALYDMTPDNSVEMNKSIKSVDSIYYFTVPCSETKINEKGYCVPDLKVSDYAYIPIGLILGRTTLTTKSGMVIDEKWLENDGLVNTYSEIGPHNAQHIYLNTVPDIALAQSGFEKGVYNVFETYRGSHNSLLGNVTKPNFEANPYLISLIEMINAI